MRESKPSARGANVHLREVALSRIQVAERRHLTWSSWETRSMDLMRPEMALRT